ncbi:MAG: extracellular solute-binding protein [Azoarcus sp.]|jgi:iron(III) transport system substrate-binding protein|nr:extracellular solute-binding protein [Azoarcus sp.]
MKSLFSSSRQIGGGLMLSLTLSLTLSLPMAACSDPEQAETAAETRAHTPAPAFAHDQAIRDLYAAALAAGESELVLYTAFPDTAALWQAFNQDFPGIRLIPSLSQQVYTRLEGEARSGNAMGDLVLAGWGTLAELVRQGRIERHVPETARHLPERYADPEGYYQLPWVNAFTLAYNTSQIAPEEVPSTWADILDERWKGKFSHPRFGGISPHDASLIVLQEGGKLSDDDLFRLREHARPSDGSGNQIVMTQLAQGRFAFILFVPAQSVTRLADSGAPIKAAFPQDATVLYGPGVGLVKGAPHPHAAKLLKNWLFTPRAQALIAAQEYAYGTMPGTPPPPGFPPVDTFEQVHIPYAEANAYFDRYRQKVATIWGLD